MNFWAGNHKLYHRNECSCLIVIMERYEVSTLLICSNCTSSVGRYVDMFYLLSKISQRACHFQSCVICEHDHSVSSLKHSCKHVSCLVIWHQQAGTKQRVYQLHLATTYIGTDNAYNTIRNDRKPLLLVTFECLLLYRQTESEYFWLNYQQ